MKRRHAHTESVVYAYGCGEPLDGLAAAEMEAARARALWDRLVDIEHEHQARVVADACRDDETLASLVAELETRLALKTVPNDDWSAERRLRRALRAQIWERLSAWRRGHVDVMREHDRWLNEQVAEARRSSGCYWGTYNDVIGRYLTARIEVRKRGQRLRKSDPAREDACLTVQIQRTQSGLGAAPEELMDGTCSQLQIEPVPPTSYDPSTSRGHRRRMYRTIVRMRIDAAGNMITLPVWMHRPLPADARVKLARLVWTRICGGSRTYRLCLTVSMARVQRCHPHPDSLALVRIDIAMQGNELRVATISGHAGRDAVTLDAHWLAMMDRVDALAAVIGDDSAGDHARIRARMERPGLWRRLLLRRREQYRLIAREIAQAHGSIIIETPALSEAAWADRNSASSVLRHRACAHELIHELQHQAAKHGATVQMRVAAASAAVPRRVRNRAAVRGAGTDGAALAQQPGTV